MKHWSSNTWVLAVLSVVLVVVGVDYGRQVLKQPGDSPTPPPTVEATTPKFKVTEAAPDFSLPDSTGNVRTLSKLVNRDTLLFFTCGCKNCRELQTYVSALYKPLGAMAPDVINVTSALPAGEKAYKRDIPLKQTMLYEPQGGSVMEQYKGHPCPRVYGIAKDRTIRWISQSMKTMPMAAEIGMEVAQHLGYRPPGESKDKRRPEFPDWQFVQSGQFNTGQKLRPETPPPAPATDAASLPPYLATPKIGGS